MEGLVLYLAYAFSLQSVKYKSSFQGDPQTGADIWWDNAQKKWRVMHSYQYCDIDNRLNSLSLFFLGLSHARSLISYCNHLDFQRGRSHDLRKYRMRYICQRTGYNVRTLGSSRGETQEREAGMVTFMVRDLDLF